MALHCFRPRVLGGLFTALGIFSCETEPPFAAKYESARLRIGTSFDDLLCKEEIIVYEAHIDVIEEVLAVSREFAWLFLYRADEGGLVAEDCRRTMDVDALYGCWVGSVARSTPRAVAHELTHAWLETAESDPLPWLAEGIAVSLSGPVQRHKGPVMIEDLLSTRVPGLSYPRAGHFATWLMARYGVERFMALYTDIPGRPTPSGLTAAFMDILGSDPEEVLLDYETTAKEYYPGIGAFACGRGERVAWIGDAAKWETGGSCADGVVRGSESTVQMQRVIVDLPASGVHVLDVGGRAASLTYCLTVPADAAELPDLPSPVTGDWQVQEALGASGGPFVSGDWAEPVALAAGTYEIWVDRTVEEGTFEAPRAMSLRRI